MTDFLKPLVIKISKILLISRCNDKKDDEILYAP